MSSICSSIAFFIRIGPQMTEGEMGRRKRDDESLNWHFSEFEWLVRDFFPLSRHVPLQQQRNGVRQKTSFLEAP